MLKRYLETLSDDEIKRLGLIYTADSSPSLTKAKCIEKLIAFFTEQNVNNLLSNLSEEEKLVLSVISLCKNIDFDNLAAFTTMQKPLLANILFRLKEKLIIFEIDNTYCLNDDFKPSKAITYYALFESENSTKKNSIIDRNTILGVLNYFYSNPIPIHPTHCEKHLKAVTLYSIFPRFSAEKIYDISKYILNFLVDNNELCIEDNHYVFKANAFIKYLSLNTPSLLSLLLFNEIDDSTIEFLSALSKIERISSKKAEGAIQKLKSIISFTKAISMQKLFLFNITEEENSYINFKCVYKEQYSSFIQINSDLSSFFQGELRIGSILPLISSAEKIDTLSLFTINKNCITKALDYFGSVDNILKALEADTKEIPALFISRLKTWFASYSRLSFVQGIVMYTNEQEAKIIDSLPLLQIHILKRLSPTVYLMNSESIDQWRRILLYAGFENLGEIKSEKEKETLYLNNIELKEEDKKEFSPCPITFDDEIEELNADDKKLAKLLDFNKTLVSQNQLKNIKRIPLCSVFPFDVKAKQVMLENVQKEKGRDIWVSLNDEDFNAVVIDVFRENNITMTKLFNLKTRTEITVPVSKIYTLTLI